MKSTSIVRVLLLAVSITVGSFTSGAQAASSEFCYTVDLRGGTAEICTDIYENPTALPAGATILAVPGLTETAAAWEPLVESIFADPQLAPFVRRVIALDLPGHGDSPVPVGLPFGLFGELLIDDNISVIIQSLGILDASGLGANAIMAHSMGGLAVQGAQEALLANGASLSHLGVRAAILLAPVPAGGQQWTQPPPADLSPFIVSDPALGTFLALPPIAFQLGNSFRTTSGGLIPNLPGLAQLTPYVGLEPIATLLQLVGQLPIPRPTARSRAFAPKHGTALSIVSFSEDVLVPAGDLDDLYAYLTGPSGKLYRPIVAPDAVHGMFISNPDGLIEAIKSLPLPF